MSGREPEIPDVLSMLRENNIEWIDLQLTDLMGVFHHVTIHRDLVNEESLKRGFGKLDGSSVHGFKTIDESDLVLKPVLTTYAVLPWFEKTARFICQVYEPMDRGRLSFDPRYMSEKTEELLANEGLTSFVSGELEFFIFDEVLVKLDYNEASYKVVSSEASWSLSRNYFLKRKEGYYPAPPLDRSNSIRQEIADIARKYFGIRAEVHHHEVASGGQAEINYRYTTLTDSADKLQTLKYIIRNVAASRGKVAVFLPKPVYGDNGSGLHVHVSIWSGSTNLFYDENDEYAELSQYARYFIGGLLEHARALSAIVSPTTNSYRRLIPGFEAPVYLVWSRANRSAAVRIPVYEKKAEKTKRIEYRPPDPTANPYLAFPAIILAGLDGVRKKIDPGDPIDENVYAMPTSKKEELGIKSLPGSLKEALDELESDHEFLKPVFSKDVIEQYIEMKRNEIQVLAQYPSPAEIHYYSYL